MRNFHRVALVIALGTTNVSAGVAVAQDLPPTLLERLLEDPIHPSRGSQAGVGSSPSSPAGTGLSPGGPMGGGPPGYDATWYPSRSVRGQSTDLGFVRQGLNVGAPIWRDDSDMLMATAGVRNTFFSTDALLPDSQLQFPKQLWNLNFGMNYMHQFDNGWTGMVMTGFGSASDKPFHSIREVTANLGGFLRIPAANDRDTWQVGAMYMAGGPVNFPLPMLSYGWNPSERLRISIGLPMSLCWKPADDLTLELSYAPLLNINAKLTYEFVPQVKLYGGYEYLNESYFLADRTDRNDRFFAFEQRLVSGLKWDIGKSTTIDLNGGYSFGRYYGSGSNQFGSLRDRVDVSAGPFLGLAVRLRF